MYHDAFNQDIEEITDLKERYLVGKVGDVEVKQKLAKALNTLLEPIRIKRAHFEQNHELVREALEIGTLRAQKQAQDTMELVRDALGLDYLKKN